MIVFLFCLFCFYHSYSAHETYHNFLIRSIFDVRLQHYTSSMYVRQLTKRKKEQLLVNLCYYIVFRSVCISLLIEDDLSIFTSLKMS